MFPFSFWGVDPFADVIQTLRLTEDFSGWFTGWTGVVQTLQLTEDFTAYFDAIWAAVIETLQLTEDFNSW